MTYEEFEWHILRLVYEEGLDRLQPSYLAYALGLPHETVNAYLEQGMHAGVLEMDLTDDGRLEYLIPGVDPSRPLPRPVWKDEVDAESGADAASPASADGSDGSVGGAAGAASRRPTVDTSRIPTSLRDHIASRYPGADGAVVGRRGHFVQSQGVELGDDPSDVGLVAAEDMVPYQEAGAMQLRVESADEAFCDPSRTMFMRQIRVYGSQSPSVIREQVARLFQSFGYRIVDSEGERMRFERGSVMFILALVPLFVLVLPLFIYLFLYCMGRSTIQQEPLELDVQFRRKQAEAEPFWEIDLTFVGLHGVVLGAADQQVLNREIDILREELRWALSS